MSLAIFVLGVAAVLVATRLRPALHVTPAANLPPTVPAATAAAPVAAPVLAPSSSPSSADEPGFGEWLKSEAERMDAPGGGDRERAMADAAAKLTPAQTHELLVNATSPESPAAEKILSTYLLVQAGPRALKELRELIAAPIAEDGPAHSEAELKHARDKTLRLMALDGLSEHAKRDPAARAALARAVDEIADPFVRSRARERLESLAR